MDDTQHHEVDFTSNTKNSFFSHHRAKVSVKNHQYSRLGIEKSQAMKDHPDLCIGMSVKLFNLSSGEFSPKTETSARSTSALVKVLFEQQVIRRSHCRLA